MRRNGLFKVAFPAILVMSTLFLANCTEVKDFFAEVSGTKKSVSGPRAMPKVFPLLKEIRAREGFYLSDRDPLKASGRFWNNKDTEGNPPAIDGHVFVKGLCVQSRSEIEYAIEPGYNTFYALVGNDPAYAEYKGSISFEVYVDGRRQFKSRPLKASTGDIEEVRIDVSGAKDLVLKVEDNGTATDYAVWAVAKIVK